MFWCHNHPKQKCSDVTIIPNNHLNQFHRHQFYQQIYRFCDDHQCTHTLHIDPIHRVGALSTTNWSDWNILGEIDRNEKYIASEIIITTRLVRSLLKSWSTLFRSQSSCSDHKSIRLIHICISGEIYRGKLIEMRVSISKWTKSPPSSSYYARHQYQNNCYNSYDENIIVIMKTIFFIKILICCADQKLMIGRNWSRLRWIFGILAEVFGILAEIIGILGKYRSAGKSIVESTM